MNDKWIYYGVFFSDKTKRFLIVKAEQLVDIPEDWKLFGGHMTIVYNDKSEDKQEMADALDNVLGYQQQLYIDSIGISEEAIAFGVKDYATQNEHSHITIAVAPGSKPVKSNEITKWVSIEGFYVTGKIDKINRK